MAHPSFTKSILLFAVFLSLVVPLSGCRGKKPANVPHGDTKMTNDQDAVRLELENADPGLKILLSDGKEGGQGTKPRNVAKASPLDEGASKALLGRMPALATEPDDAKSFSLRPRSQPAPRTGETVPHAFPPKPSAATAPGAGGPLTVTRYAPEGKVPLAPHLSVTFSQPMVAVTSHDEAQKTVPVTVSPKPPGTWRWIGTKTVLFEPDGRFPMATTYQVSIPKGTVSANGESLEKATNFSFSTPTVTLKSFYPTHDNGPQGLTPVVFVGFDQRIDPEAVLQTLELRANDDKHPVRMATEEEIRQDERVKGLVDAAKKRDNGRRWLVVTPKEPLPKNASVVVAVTKGTPSAEGPLRTTGEQSFHFRTYPPLTITKSFCSYGRDCPPGSDFVIRFSNPLDEESFDADTIDVSPKLAGYKAYVSHQDLYVRGRSKGRVSYAVTVPKTIKDAFGQTLGQDAVRRFRVGDAEPQLFGAQAITVADPSAQKPTFDVHSINISELSVQIYQVTPKDWEAFGRFMQRNPRRPEPAPGRKVFDKTVRIQGEADGMVDTSIDLSPALSAAGKGHAVVVVEPTTWPNRYKPRIQTWVQVTDIGLDAFTDAEELIAWTTDLATGKPLADVEVFITHTQKRTQSDAKGLAVLPLDEKAPGKDEHQMLVAKRGDDSALLPQRGAYFWSGSSAFRGQALRDTLQWFTFDDRGMYKPGETVRVKGWLRIRENREGGDIQALGKRAKIAYTVMGPRGNKLTEGKTTVNAMGGFDLSFALPKTPNLGYASVQLTATGTSLPNSSARHGFQIQEFRRPEFEVTSNVSQGPHIVGKGADVTVSAKYYAGGALGAADVNWTVHSTPTNFTPPNQDDYSFGRWVPWWGWGYRGGGMVPNVPSNRVDHVAKTDASGRHVLHMDFVSVDPPQPMSVVAEASVMDVNRQAWATKSTLLVHPSELYIGLQRDRYFVEKGKPIELTGVVVDQDGKAISGRAAVVRAVRLDWQIKKGKYEQIEEDSQTCEIQSTDKPFACTFQTPVGGTYKIVATVKDDLGRPNETEITTWVSGGDLPPERNVAQEEITLVPDKKEYAGGDTAKLMVMAPFYPADGVLSIRRSGIVTTRSFHMAEGSTTLEVAIQDAHVPNVFVQVDLVGSAVRVDDNGKKQPSLPRRPAYAKGAINLAVPPTKRTLNVAVTPKDKKLAPGAKTSVSVRVTDSAGKPVNNAELVVMAVDEAVLALSNYATPDPITGFYRARPAGGSDYHQRQWLRLANPDDDTLGGPKPANEAVEEEMAYGFGAENALAEADMAMAAAPAERSLAPAKTRKSVRDRGQGPATSPIAVRTNFDALAAFAPTVATNAAGTATVSIDVPDNLTRYRIMVVAAAGDNHFGKGENTMTARMPLMVRPSPPRFLNFGDRFELPVVLQNQTDSDMTVDVAVRATNVEITKGAGRKVMVPANDRVEVRFPAATEMAGVARFQVAAKSGAAVDANEFALPVWTPATTEAFATYGEIDQGAIKQPVRMPPNVVTSFGGLEISMASTQLQALTDALLYLVQYPYECAEQTSSRILGVAALRDVLTAFNAKEMPAKDKIEEAVKRDIERLSALQNPDGGFAFWVKGHESWPYISIHAAHALTRAKDKGFLVPESMLKRSQDYLQKVERHIPPYYSLRTRRMLIAYALYTRKRMGDTDVARAKKLIESAGLTNLPMESLGWLMHVLHGDAQSKELLAQIHKHLGNKVSETAATANWVDGYDDDAHLVLYSSRRADGVLLESLIEDKPKSDLIPKVVRGLLAHRKRGKWGNTQENVFVLLAMDRYFHTYEGVTPNFVAKLWLGDGYAGDQAFRGRSTDRHAINVPMGFLAKTKGDADLVLSKTGKGRLYYRIGMTYAPSDLQLPAADHGFTVERTYEAVDDANDVTRSKDGSYKIRAGARVRVRLTLVAENRRYHVALVDPLPAGLEAMNPALAVTGAIPQDKSAESSTNRWWWWNRTWYEHQNMRDERVEAFTSLLWAGVHKYDYVARATTPGRFIVPPTKAEEMYFPETFGRTKSDVVIVE